MAKQRIRDLIDAVVLTLVGEAELSIDLRGAFASMPELCACDGIKNAPEAMALEALQFAMVAGAHNHLKYTLQSQQEVPSNFLIDLRTRNF